MLSIPPYYRVKNCNLIVDCQYGSTGKGLLAGYLGALEAPQVLCMAPSPNAGHTLVEEDGTARVHKMLPLGITSPSLERIYLGPGSVIDMDRLLEEYLALPRQVELWVHQNAAVVLQEHRDEEAAGGLAPGSTRSGAGSAFIAKIRRRPGTLLFGEAVRDHPLHGVVRVVDTRTAQDMLFRTRSIQAEGCQGYSLSVHHGAYPYCTARDVTTAQLIADCGLPYDVARIARVVGSMRTYPIRVANRPEAGEWSAPCYPDSVECQFADLGLEQEYTTVTKLPRRIFTFSAIQAHEAIAQNGVDEVFLNFAQYPPSLGALEDILDAIEARAEVTYVGFGPKSPTSTTPPPGQSSKVCMPATVAELQAEIAAWIHPLNPDRRPGAPSPSSWRRSGS